MTTDKDKRARAEVVLAEYRHNYYNPNKSPVPVNPMASFEVDAMLAYADERVKAALVEAETVLRKRGDAIEPFNRMSRARRELHYSDADAIAKLREGK